MDYAIHRRRLSPHIFGHRIARAFTRGEPEGINQTVYVDISWNCSHVCHVPPV